MAVIGRPHGLRGLVRVHAYATEPKTLEAYPLHDAVGRAWRLAWRGEGVAELRDGAGRAVADRTAAERLVNTELFVARDALPAPAPDEFYFADLIGLEVRAAGGTALGRVAAVHDYGGGASLEIEGAAGSLIVPFTQAAVPEIDVAAGVLRVTPPIEIDARSLE